MNNIPEEQLEKIRKYTRREMMPSELFVFSVLLCDNQIDRDGERFSKAALENLAALYLGKTGVFDHEAKAKNQTARIFDTQVIREDKEFGTEYFGLKAWAYMVRSEKNEGLILEIDGGIKKEVSVGCAVSEVLCSICGQDHKKGVCSHIKGVEYQGGVCHHLLVHPTDAYEWSFVAVPAQPLAGVTKTFSSSHSPPLIEKINKSSEDLLLQEKEVKALQKHLEALTALAKKGQDYLNRLEKEILQTSGLVQPDMDLQVLEELCKSASIEQLERLHKAYSTLGKTHPYFGAQLGVPANDELDTSFQI